MASRSRSLSRWSFLVLALGFLALAACTENYPRSTLAPESDFARVIDDLFDTIFWWGLGVFVLVEALLLFVLFRYRRRPGEESHPEQIHGHTRLEIAWTIAPALILAFIAVPTVRTIFITQDERPIPGALNVRVIAHQWWWEFQLPEYEFATANELHVPVGRTVSFQLESADVIHSFWVPRLGGKRDVVPLRTNQLWFTADEPGTYLGQCAEYCGLSHALMGLRVVVDTPEDFQAWVANQRRPASGSEAAPRAAATGAGEAGAPGPPAAKTSPGEASAAGRAAGAAAAAAGAGPDERVAAAQEAGEGEVEGEEPQPPAMGPQDAAVGATQEALPAREPAATPEDSLARTFAAVGDPSRGAQIAQGVCAACHTIRGTNARGRLGPDLTHVGSRARIAAEVLPNTPDGMARWLRDPPAVKPGALMPNMNLKEDQIADLVVYLQSLK